ncbi:hypothetical protein FGE12_14330 [Aggregicoccus sp. 17bor-14]|uniref:hypothetical protein n=1 Tax=Myxococcaceae TaxID=31 RepID=UPI00129C7829|nr:MULTISPECIES: hypothetical protein [Myxococcaceae]MBF5043570.1 hypothetical protein [Simulacricoccus sp. 17bor-14]MRI89329.1 hypothetical protein [Aggregicoccus sp. 17bor-14]
MSLKKLTTLLVVDRIEPCLSTWQALGYAKVMQVPETGAAGFAILAGPAGELMLQTRESLAEDLPVVAALKPTHVLYADVPSLAEAKRALSGARVLVEQRTTFYGATESWLQLVGGTVLGLAEHKG